MNRRDQGRFTLLKGIEATIRGGGSVDMPLARLLDWEEDSWHR